MALWVSGVPATSRTAKFHTPAFFPPQILQCLLVLASDSLRALEEQLMDPLNSQDVKIIFHPPLDCYNVLIHLNPNQIPCLLESMDQPLKLFSQGMVKNSTAVKILFPMVNVQCYLQELGVNMALWGGIGGYLPKEELPSAFWHSGH
ncbi:nucleolar protein 6 [Grus japonensis]|uniref:Nucleolar protein 6 n=1 Tax=Grus japonensis TaxID=30415 RepID=A0ABC9YHR8_GRUJA